MSLPPAWARALLKVVLPASRLDDVLGDLKEVHSSGRRPQRLMRAWFAASLEALRIVGAFLIYRSRRWRTGFMTQWVTWLELKLGWRLMRKQPLLAIACVLALAIGIGLATIGFTLRDAVLTDELPFEGGDRFVLLTIHREPDGRRVPLDLERFDLFRNNADSLDYLGALRPALLNILHPSGDVESIEGTYLTPSSFRFLPFPPSIGRSLTTADGQPGAAPVVLIGESFWERRFHRDPAAVGSRIEISGESREVVGVMSKDFQFPFKGQLWLPLDERNLGAGSSGNPPPAIRVFGVLEEGSSLRSAQAQLDSLSSRVDALHPSRPARRIVVDSFPQGFVGGPADLMTTVLVAVLVLVLVVIAANVANLILARTSSRLSELAIRSALGAGRGRLVGQVFLEVVLLGVVAAGLGLAAAATTLGYLRRMTDDIPFWVTFVPTWRTMFFVTAITLLASAVAGALPALKATRQDPANRLLSHWRGGQVGLGRLGGLLIVAEIALSVAALGGAAVMARALIGHLNRDFGLPSNRILTAQIYVEPTADAQAAGREQEYLTQTQLEVIQAARGLPGVAAAGAATQVPRMDPPARPLAVASEGDEAESAPRSGPVAGAGPGFFKALDVEALAGRLIAEPDVATGAPPVAVVNQPFVERFLAGRNPIGRRVRIASDEGDPAEQWRTIVGVVRDLGLSAADDSSSAGIYIPMQIGQNGYFLLVMRAQGDPLQLDMPLRREILKIDPSIRVSHVALLEDVGKEDRTFFSVAGSSLVAISAAGLALSMMGVYAILSFAVQTRTREIGVRMALGAARGRILWSLVGRSSFYLAAGAAIGSLLAWALTQARGIFVTRLPTDGPGWILLLVVVLLAVAGLIASWVPARRALGIRPAEALRE